MDWLLYISALNSHFSNRQALAALPENAEQASSVMAQAEPVQPSASQATRDLAHFKRMLECCEVSLLREIAPCRVEVILRPNGPCTRGDLGKGFSTVATRFLRERAVGQRGVTGASARPVHAVIISRNSDDLVQSTMTVGYPDGRPTCLRVLPTTDIMSRDDKAAAEHFNPRVQTKIETTIDPVVFGIAQLMFYAESEHLAKEGQLPNYSNSNLRLLLSSFGLPLSVIDRVSSKHQNCQTGTSEYITRLVELQNALVDEVERNPAQYPVALRGIQRVGYDQFDWSRAGGKNISGAKPIAAGWCPGGRSIEASLSWWQKVHVSPFPLIAAGFLILQQSSSLCMRAISNGANTLGRAAQRVQGAIVHLNEGENAAV